MKVMVAMIITILVVSLLTLFWPSERISVNNEPFSTPISSVMEGDKKKKSSSAEKLNSINYDEKVTLMKAEYAILEKSRKQLKQRLAGLKHEIWGIEFPAETAKQMSKVMLDAYRLIKNTDMLGAFSNVEEIEGEVAKLNFADKSLDQLDEIILENKESLGKE